MSQRPALRVVRDDEPPTATREERLLGAAMDLCDALSMLARGDNLGALRKFLDVRDGLAASKRAPEARVGKS